MTASPPPQPLSWFVTGAGGMLGHRLVETLTRRGLTVTAATSVDLDITDAAAVATALTSVAADVVVNAAAYTKVDDAESHEQLATVVNADGAAHVAAAAARAGSALLHISTDYVFDGTATQPYDEDTPTAPVSAYGRSKAAGEAAVLSAEGRTAVVRTAWLYGPGGGNFVSTMLRLEGERDTVQVVDDQVGQPTCTDVVIDALLALAPTVAAGQASGCFHATCAGETSWHGLASETFRLAGADPARVEHTDSTAFQRPAPRPAFSVLSHRRWQESGLWTPPPWQDALATVFPELRPPDA